MESEMDSVESRDRVSDFEDLGCIESPPNLASARSPWPHVQPQRSRPMLLLHADIYTMSSGSLYDVPISADLQHGARAVLFHAALLFWLSTVDRGE